MATPSSTRVGAAVVLLALALLSSAAHAAALTPAQEFQAAVKALASTPGFTKLTTYGTFIKKVEGQIKSSPVTLLAPSDAALNGALSTWRRFFGKVTATINMHMLQGALNVTQLQALPVNSAVATKARLMLTKVSAVGASPAKFRSPSVRFPDVTTVVRTIFVGKSIVVYGTDTVLVP